MCGEDDRKTRVYTFSRRAPAPPPPPPARHQRGGEAGACRRVCVGWWGRDLHGGAGAACEWRRVGVRALCDFYVLILFNYFSTQMPAATQAPLGHGVWAAIGSGTAAKKAVESSKSLAPTGAWLGQWAE